MTGPPVDLHTLGALIDAMPVALAVFDADQSLVAANRRYAELIEHPIESLHGRQLHDACPNALADLDAQITAVRNDGRPASQLIDFRGARGARRVEVTLSPFPTVAEGWLFIGLDVTERETLRETLALNVEELEAIFATIPDAVRVFGANGEVIRLNAQARRAHDPTPLTVASLWQADRPRGPDGSVLFLHEHPATRALSGESVRGQQLVLRRSGAEATLDVNAEPLRGKHGQLRGAVTVDRDVTVTAKLAQELAEQVRAREAQAEQLEQIVAERTAQLLALQEDRERDRRLAAVGQLAAGVMHDVNNVLNPILAAAYLIDASADNAADVREYAQHIAKAAETGVSRLAGLRRFIRQEPIGEKVDEVMDLASEVEAVLAMLAPTWEQRSPGTAIAINRELAPGARIRGLTGEIRAALLNLVQNAVDAMPAGGTLGVATAVRLGEAIVEVRDTGIGMSPEVRQRAFEPFYSTKGAKGTGLGLAEVYGIVKSHRGTAEIESNVGQGTIVRLRFPRVADGP